MFSNFWHWLLRLIGLEPYPPEDNPFPNGVMRITKIPGNRVKVEVDFHYEVRVLEDGLQFSIVNKANKTVGEPLFLTWKEIDDAREEMEAMNPIDPKYPKTQE